MERDSIGEIFEESNKAELCEALSNALSVEGVRVALVTGIPEEGCGLDITVYQHGHQYNYELFGYLREALSIVDNGEYSSV